MIRETIILSNINTRTNKTKQDTPGRHTGNKHAPFLGINSSERGVEVGVHTNAHRHVVSDLCRHILGAQKSYISIVSGPRLLLCPPPPPDLNIVIGVHVAFDGHGVIQAAAGSIGKGNLGTRGGGWVRSEVEIDSYRKSMWIAPVLRFNTIRELQFKGKVTSGGWSLGLKVSFTVGYVCHELYCYIWTLQGDSKESSCI